MTWYMAAATLGTRQVVGLPLRAEDERDARRQLSSLGFEAYYLNRRDTEPSPVASCPECGADATVRPGYMQEAQGSPLELLCWVLHCRRCNRSRQLYKDGRENETTLALAL